MSKKQSLTRAIALGLLLSTPFCELALAAPGVDGTDVNKTITIEAGGKTETPTATNATDATEVKGDNGGKGGSVTIQANIGANTKVTSDINLTGTAGKGGEGSGNGDRHVTPSVPGTPGKDGGVAGAGGSSTVGIDVEQGTLNIQATKITITAIGGQAGGYAGSSLASGTVGGVGGAGGHAEAYGLKIHSSSGTVDISDQITISATAGSGGYGASAVYDDNGSYREDAELISDRGIGGSGGHATATGLILNNSNAIEITTKKIDISTTAGNATGAGKENEVVQGSAATSTGLDIISTSGTATAEDITTYAKGGEGGYGASAYYATGASGVIGGLAASIGISVVDSDMTVTAQDLDITAIGGQGGQGGSSYYDPGIGGLGGAARAYGLQLLSKSGAVTVSSIVIQATGGQGGNGGEFYYSFDKGNKNGTSGGLGGEAAAYGIHGSGDGLLTVDSITVTATGGQGGRGAKGKDAYVAGKTSGDGGDGGDGGSGYAYGVAAAANGSLNVVTDSIAATAAGGAGGTGGYAGSTSGGATSGSAGSDGQEGTGIAYGVYAEQGSTITLSGKSSNTLDIGVTATGTGSKAYSVYADGGAVFFGSSANLNKKADLSADNTAITHLSNATLGFAGQDTGRTITGGTLSLQGSNTFVVNTDLANNTADKITFDSLAAGSSSAAQYITIGYDPAIDPANLGTVDLASNLEIFEITNLNGQNLNNFQAKTNVLDSTLYKFTVTPEVGLDTTGNKIEISGITTAKLALPSESVMTASDTMTGVSSLWRIEGNNLMKRMGDLRSDPEAAKGGVWARYYGGEMSAAGSYGRSLSQDYTAFQGGIDKVQDYHSGRLYTGIAINHISSNSDYSAGRGEGSSTGVGLYTSWLGDKGHYVDVILRASRLNSNFKAFTTTGLVTGDYSTWAYGLSAEYGYKHKMQAGWFVEPQAELSFGHINSASYTMSNGAKMDNSSINSVTGRLGFILGKEFKTAQRLGNVYMKGSLYHEFGGKGSMIGYYNTDYIHADGAPGMGTWYELGLGTNLGIAKNSNLYVDASKTFGGKINTKWQINAGVRVSF